MSNEATLSEFIKSYVLSHSITINDLAKMMRVPHSTVARYQMGMDQRVKDGKPVAAHDTFLHRKIRDMRGESYTYAPREENRPKADMIANWLLEGVSYFNIALKCVDFGIVRANGHMWQSDVRNLMLSPITWGAIARRYKNLRGIWAFDASVPLPVGVTIERDTHPPFWTGDYGMTIQDELRRREVVIKGRGWPDRITAFSGLIVCDYCGFRMSYSAPKPQWRYYLCTSNCTHKNRLVGRSCDSIRKSIPFDSIVDWLKPLLARCIAAGDMSPLFGSRTPQPVTDVERLTALLTNRRVYADQLLEDRANTPMALRSNLQTLIEKAAREISTIEDELSHVSRQQAASIQQVTTNRAVLKELTTLDVWSLPETRQNQIFHALFGNLRLSVRDGEIVAIVEAQ